MLGLFANDYLTYHESQDKMTYLIARTRTSPRRAGRGRSSTPAIKCGIAGFVGAGDRETLARMTARLAHRGPDDSGLWSDGPVFLGHRRLSIVDLEGGHQPMTTADGNLILIFNGEIYNHAELRAELKARGHFFQTDHSDSEVLLHGYREWGAALPNRLNGMWAFALCDQKNARLFAAATIRKAFYYSAGPGHLLSPGVNRTSPASAHSAECFKRALRKYFAYGYIPAPLDLRERVCYPAAVAGADIKTLVYRIERYWNLVLEPFDNIPNPEEEWANKSGAARRGPTTPDLGCYWACF